MPLVSARDEVLISRPAAPEGPVIHVCWNLVPAAKRVFPKVRVSRAADDSNGLAFAQESLLLDERLVTTSYDVVPQELQTGPNVLWVEMDNLPLLAPLPVVMQRRIDLEWGITLMPTPSSLGVQAPPAVIESVAWSILARYEKEFVVRLCAVLALQSELHMEDAGWQRRLVELIEPPSAVRGGLLCAARSGTPVLNPGALRWILRELVAMQTDGAAAHDGQILDPGSDEYLLGNAWFPCISTGSAPGIHEAILAIWMLQEVYSGATNAHGLRAEIAAMTFGLRAGGHWWTTLERSRRMWAIEATHPSLVGRADPAQMSSAFERVVGVTPTALVAGIWFLAVRWMLPSIDAAKAPPMTLTQILSCDFGAGPVQLCSGFEQALEEYFISDVSEFGSSARSEAKTDDPAVGSLPQNDSLVPRNNPIIRFADGSCIPVSLELLAERAASLFRVTMGSHIPNGGANQQLGYLFEAYVHDLARSLNERHFVAGAQPLEMASSLRGQKACDVVIASPESGAYLFVEASTQTISRRVAAGDASALTSLAGRYQREFEQAKESADRAHALHSSLGGPVPTSTCALVVVDQAILHTPALTGLLAELQPDRTTRFICGVDEFEFLVGMGRAGWGVPGVVSGWQSKTLDGPLQEHLARLSKILPPIDDSDEQPFEALTTLLPFESE